MVQHHEPTKAPLKQWNVTVSIVDDGGGHITSLLQTRGVGYHRDGDRIIVSVPALAADADAARASVAAGVLLRGVLTPGVRWDADAQEVVEPYVEGIDSPEGAQSVKAFNADVTQADPDLTPVDEEDEEIEEVEEEPEPDDAPTADELVAELLAALNDGDREWSVSEEQPEGGELAVEHDPEVDGRIFYFTAADCVGYVAVTEAGLPLVAQREGDNWARTFAGVIAGQVQEVPKVEEPKVEEPKKPTPPPVAKKTTAAKPKDDSKKDTKRGGRRGGSKK